MLLWLLVGLLVGISLTLLLVERRGGKHSHAVALALVFPIVTNKEGKTMANYELPNDAVAYVPIQTLDASGNPVPPPAGDTFTVTSSDPGLGVAVGTMPSGPLQGQTAAVLTPLVLTDANVTVTLTDADGLTAFTQIVDIIQGVATTDFLDISAAVTVPQAPPAGAAKPKA